VLLAAFVAYDAAASAFGTPLTAALFVASFLMKLIVAPIGIWVFADRNPAARDLRPGINVPIRIVIVIGLGLIALGVTRQPSLAATPLAGTAFYVVLCGLAVLIVHRNLLAAIIGLLVLGTGVTLTGVAIAPGLPESIELGAAFDGLVATFVGLALARAFLTHNPLLDITALRRLRG
jgi:hydrogenase-4 membrane subunit HyfE